ILKDERARAMLDITKHLRFCIHRPPGFRVPAGKRYAGEVDIPIAVVLAYAAILSYGPAANEFHAAFLLPRCAAMLRMMPTEASAARSAVPPCETNGSGSPVSGNMESIAPILRNADTAIRSVRPDTVSMPKDDDACAAIMNPRAANAT